MSRAEMMLEKIAKSGRVANAYLFISAAGADKFADLLGCARQDKFTVSPDGQSLKIDQIRELQQMVRFGPSRGPYLVVMIREADRLTDEAAAAFLKTLEEPAPKVVFILVSAREDKLPATILSRCQKVFFGEEERGWEKGENPFYTELEALKNKKIPEQLQLAGKLEKEKEGIEELLYDLAQYARYGLSDIPAARIILDTIRFIKRRANLKLALDVMCLKLGGNNVQYATR